MIQYFFPAQNIHIILLNLTPLNTAVTAGLILIGCLTCIYAVPVRSISFYLFGGLFLLTSVLTVTAGDFISLLIFLEAMTVVSYLLIIFPGTKPVLKTGLLYFIIHIIGGSVLLYGIFIQYRMTGTTILGKVHASAVPFFVIGYAMKCGLFPFHIWIADAHPKAFFPVSVLLSAFTPKVVVYLIAATLAAPVIVYLGIFTALYGVVLALFQYNGKKLLAYHTVSQVGYMLAGIGLASQAGINAGMCHLFNNMIYKSLLFMVVGSIFYRTGTAQINKLGGMMRRMPLTFMIALTAALSISGVPFFSGYVSKTLLSQAISASQSTVVKYGLLAAGVGTLLSFTKFIYYIFLRPSQGEVDVKPPSYWMLAPMLILACICIITGVNPGILSGLSLAVGPTEMFFSTAKLFSGFLAAVVSILLFIVLKKHLHPGNPICSDVFFLYRKISSLYEKTAAFLNRLHSLDIQVQLIIALFFGVVIALVI